jgi:uncharacterized protein YdeI (YjbR/CyaY-like superfamily)
VLDDSSDRIAGLPVVAFGSQADWARWLGDEHSRSDGVWLKIAKKGTGVASVNYPEALEVALCWGWIDGQRGRFDATYFLTRFTPRKRRSRWSAINCRNAEELIARGEMRPAGFEQIATAKADGRWDAAYPGQRAAVVPDDLRAALDASPAAAQFFAGLDSANRYAFLYRLHHVTDAAARPERIASYVAMLGRGEALHPAPRSPRAPSS